MIGAVPQYRLAVAATPTPVRATEPRGVPRPIEPRFNVALLVPVEVGKKYTCMLHAAPAASVVEPAVQSAPETGTTLNRAASVPLKFTMGAAVEVEPVLVNVSTAPPDEPTVTFPKLSGDGDNANVAAAVS